MLYISGLLGQGYRVFLPAFLQEYILKDIVNTRNGIFFSLPFVSIGYYMSLKNIERVQRKFITASALIISLCLQMIEMNILGKANFYMFTMPFSACLFLLIINKPTIGFKTNIYKTGKYSLGIYGIHVFFITLLKRLQLKNVFPVLTREILSIFVVFLLSLATTYLLYRNKHLKQLLF